MRNGANALVFAILVAPFFAHADEQRTLQASVGAWQATSFQDAVNPGCSMGADGSLPGSRFVMGVNARRPYPVNMLVRKGSWSIPPDTEIKVRVGFPDGSSFDLSGHGKDHAANFDLSGATLFGLAHALTANKIMELAFSGNEPVWKIDLTGTDRTILAMRDCVAAHHLAGVDPFFQPVPQPAEMQAPTQPFGGEIAHADNAPLEMPQPDPSGDNKPGVVAELPEAGGESGAGANMSMAQAPPPMPPQNPPSDVADGCANDWRACKDNAALAKEYKEYAKIKIACRDHAEQGEQDATLEWADPAEFGLFSNYKVGNDYITTGIAYLSDQHVQTRSKSGVVAHVMAVCEFDLKGGNVNSVLMFPE